ncbi:MAG: D-alanyl-D-alanine carboxypeptidase [Bacteroidota bacterium]
MPIFLIGQKTDFAKEWKNDKGLRGASLAYCVMDAKTSSVLSEFNAFEQIIPASTLKIVSTTGALQILGADFRYSTKLLYTGTFK